MDDLVSCPYDVGHTMKRHRLQVHLLKCRRNNPQSFLWDVCLYNSSHHVKKENMNRHLQFCPDRAKQAYRVTCAISQDEKHKAKPIQVDAKKDSEDWSSEEDEPPRYQYCDDDDDETSLQKSIDKASSYKERYLETWLNNNKLPKKEVEATEEEKKAEPEEEDWDTTSVASHGVVGPALYGLYANLSLQ